MGWVWRDDKGEDFDSSAAGVSSGSRCSTSKVIKSQCRTEEVEPGKFIRKCEKTEQVLRDCVGKPVEVVQSNKEYTEEDVTEEVLKGSLTFGKSEEGALDFPGLRSDIDAISRSFLGGLSRFFEEAEEMKNEFFNVFGAPRLFDGESSSSSASMRRGTPTEGDAREDSYSKPAEREAGHIDLSGLAKDV